VELSYKHVKGGGVPGGHNVIWDGRRKPFITPMHECKSIPLRHSDVVVDIGAYVGTYAIRCARFPVKQVVAYEPTPRTFAVLALTRLPNLRLVNAAVIGGAAARVDLHVSAGIGVTNSIVLSRRKPESISVRAVSYGDAVRGASVVKVDVEGAEYGYPIVQPSLRAAIIDFHPIPGVDWVAKARAVIASLEAAGFEAVVEPDFSCGWTSAGSWVRPMETSGECAELMRGELCCGCGAPVAGKQKSLCPTCYEQWDRRHSVGFERARLADLGHP